MEPSICNVIATCQLETKSEESLNLRYLAEKVEGSRLNSKKFPGLIIRKSSPKGTVILFKSYKAIIIGCSSINDCELLSKKIAKDIQKIVNINVSVKTFDVKNIVANARLGYRINIGLLADQNYAFKDDKNPGVLLKLREIKSALVFGSGKVMLTGAKKIEDICGAFSAMKTKLSDFRIK